MNRTNLIDLVYERQWSSLGNLVQSLRQVNRLGTLYGGFPRFRYLKAGIPADHLKTFPVAALWNHALLKGSLPSRLKMEEPKWVGRWVATRSNLATTIIANGTAHRYVFPKLAGKGHKLVLERGSMHPEDYFHFPQQARKEAGYPYQTELPAAIQDEICKNNLADFLIAGSEMVRESYCRRGFPRDRAFTCRYGVNPEKFPYVQRTPPTNRPVRVAAIGVIGFRKGLHRLIQLSEWAKTRGIAIEIHLAGPIEDPEAHEMLGKTTARIFCHGVLKGSEFRQFLQEADLCAVFSYEEGLPVAMLEAMCCGLPALVGTDTGAREVIEDGVDGILLEEFSSDAFDQKLANLLRNPERIPTMGQNAHQKVITQFTSERYMKDLHAILEIIHSMQPRTIAT